MFPVYILGWNLEWQFAIQKVNDKNCKDSWSPV